MPRGYFIYPTDEKSAYTGGFFRGQPDPHRSYVLHYGHFLELSFIARNTTGLDHFQAEKELQEKCIPKLERLFKRTDFNLKTVLPEIMKLKQDWNATDIPDRWSRV